MRNIELLAPAGNTEALRAAVQSGADAVYIGGEKFGARHGAANFTIEEIKRQADYCRLYGVDLHAAVNTLIKEKELESLMEYVYALSDAGVGALIIQDVGAASAIKRALPDMPLHASTQMTVTSLEGVKYLEKAGFSRVVLARELSMSEIEYIVKNSKAEIEVFAHGAICMCYSGQCLMSSMLGGRSGNRGRCAQPCRLPYDLIKDGDKVSGGYILSPKDMALIASLKDLKRIGVASLKIEGRLKRSEYVSAVTGVYRKYIDNPKRVLESDMRELLNAFSRGGFTDGYFKGRLGRGMMSIEKPGNDADNIFTEEARARINGNIRKIPVKISASLDDKLKISISDNDGNIVYAESEAFSQKALNKPMDEERLKAQLIKLGQTPFECSDTEIYVSKGITIPIREINETRRKACDMLIEKRQQGKTGRKIKTEIKRSSQIKKNEVFLSAEVRNIEQARACIKNGIKIIYAPLDVASKIDAKDAAIVVKTPAVFKHIEFDGEFAEVSSPAAAGCYAKKRLYGGFRLNVFNSLTADLYKDMELVTVSPELNLREISDISSNTDAKLEAIGYGRIPLMLVKNCPLKAAGKCQNGKNIYSMRDRKRAEFPIICNKDCIPEILNSRPIYMADKLSDLTKTGISCIRLIFSVENFSQCDKIIGMYTNALNGHNVKNIFDENGFTRGHFYRGVD